MILWKVINYELKIYSFHLVLLFKKYPSMQASQTVVWLTVEQLPHLGGQSIAFDFKQNVINIIKHK